MGEIRPPDEVIENPKKPTKSAIRPPDEVIVNPDKPTKSSVVEETPKKAKRKALDIWMGLVLFIVTGIELVSWVMPQNHDYLIFWCHLLYSASFVVFGTFFIAKYFRYKSCIYSKVAGIGYTLIQIITFFSILLPGTKVVIMLMLVKPVIVVSIIISLLILFTRWILQRHV